MLEENQPLPQPATRPSVQPLPLQRANYGITPPRPMPPQTAAPRMMDVNGPVRPFQPPAAQAAPTPPPPPQPVTTPAPSMLTMAPHIPASPITPAPAVQPLFSASPVAAKATPAQSKKISKLASKWRLAVLILGLLLALGGAGRWVTAGSTTGDIVAVAAVKANDGRTMTIQFTANDGQLHKFSDKSEANLIPGTALEVAYKPGAPEATVKRVSIIHDNRALGVRLFAAGLAFLVVAGFASLVHTLRRSKVATPLTTPVTV